MTGPVLSEEEVTSNIGRPLPGGTYTIEPWKAWLTHDAVLAPEDREVAHPIFVFLAATGGMGLSWDELFAWFGSSSADGPMFGDCQMEFIRPLLIGSTYQVSGVIESVVRKHGRRAGVFDLVNYLLELHDDEGQLVATCRNSLVLPRRD